MPHVNPPLIWKTSRSYLSRKFSRLTLTQIEQIGRIERISFHANALEFIDTN